jgi:hypothetical protein
VWQFATIQPQGKEGIGMKNGPRMTKQSKLRKIAKRQLPKRLRKHGSATHAAAIEAKKPHEPRSVQRMKKIKFRELQRRHDSTLGGDHPRDGSEPDRLSPIQIAA